MRKTQRRASLDIQEKRELDSLEKLALSSSSVEVSIFAVKRICAMPIREGEKERIGSLERVAVKTKCPVAKQAIFALENLGAWQSIAAIALRPDYYFPISSEAREIAKKAMSRITKGQAALLARSRDSETRAVILYSSQEAKQALVEESVAAGNDATYREVGEFGTPELCSFTVKALAKRARESLIAKYAYLEIDMGEKMLLFRGLPQSEMISAFRWMAEAVKTLENAEAVMGTAGKEGLWDAVGRVVLLYPPSGIAIKAANEEIAHISPLEAEKLGKRFEENVYAILAIDLCATQEAKEAALRASHGEAFKFARGRLKALLE